MTVPYVIDAGAVQLAFRTLGQHQQPPIVLIHGLGQTLCDWPETFLSLLAIEGRRLIAFDNRDVGGSTRFDAFGAPPLVRMILGAKLGLRWSPQLAYCLLDMAADVLGLLDVLKISRAHLVGVSMGGMIAQRLTCARPERVASLTCIMSSSGAPGLPAPDRDVSALLFKSPRQNPVSSIGHALQLRRRLAGKLDRRDDHELRDRVARSIAYGQPAGGGASRQYAAILQDRNRWRMLDNISAPTLIVHGDADPLLPPDHGRDLAWRVPTARFELIPGMGHELVEGRAGLLARLIASHLGQADDQTLTPAKV